MAFTTNQQIIIDLFIATYGRTPTQNALDFFTFQLDTKEMTSSSITNFMLNTNNNPEAELRYPDNIETQEKIEKVFNNILGRGTRSQEGLDFWVSRVDNEDNYSMSSLIQEILGSAKSQSGDAETLKNKSNVVEYFLEKTPANQQSNKLVYLDDIIYLGSGGMDIEKIDEDKYLLTAENFMVEFGNIEQLYFSDHILFEADFLI